jgi:hypothetical protein
MAEAFSKQTPEHTKRYLEMDIQQEINEIIKSEIARKYSKKHMPPSQRIAISLLAEKCGLVAYGEEFDSTKGGKRSDQMFIVGPRRTDTVVTMDEYYIKRFSEQIGAPFPVVCSKEKFLELVEIYRLQREHDIFFAECSAYGFHGMKRRDELMMQHMVDTIAKHPVYISDIASDKPIEDIGKSFMDKSFTIAKKVYSPENDRKMFISIDIRASIFNGYRDLGIIAQRTWKDFVRSFSNSELLLLNKGFRLRVFGKLNHKGKNETLIRNSIASHVHKIQTLPLYGRTVAIEGDEIIVETSEEAVEKDIQDLIDLKLGEDCRISGYRLRTCKYGSKTTYFVREFFYHGDKDPEFGLDKAVPVYDLKCVPKHIHLEVFLETQNRYKSLISEQADVPT